MRIQYSESERIQSSATSAYNTERPAHTIQCNATERKYPNKHTLARWTKNMFLLPAALRSSTTSAVVWMKIKILSICKVGIKWLTSWHQSGALTCWCWSGGVWKTTEEMEGCHLPPLCTRSQGRITWRAALAGLKGPWLWFLAIRKFFFVLRGKCRVEWKKSKIFLVKIVMKHDQITYINNEQITHYTRIPHFTLTLFNISCNRSLFTGSSTGNMDSSVSQYPFLTISSNAYSLSFFPASFISIWSLPPVSVFSLPSFRSFSMASHSFRFSSSAFFFSCLFLLCKN